MPRPPQTFHGFIGQRDVVDRLQQQLNGARAHGESCASILLIGPSGVGKTALARATAKELGTSLHLLNGQEDSCQIAARLLEAKGGDVVLVDEAHAAGQKAQELFYSAIDESRVPHWACPPFSGGSAPSGPQETAAPAPDNAGDGIKIPRITLIFATDQPGRLCNALQKRMELTFLLLPYPPREMRWIVDRIAKDAGLDLSGQARSVIVRALGGMPREARHHVANLRRHLGPDNKRVGVAEVRDYLAAFKIDRKGLNPEHRKVLRYLKRVGRASIESLATRLGVDTQYVQRRIEPLLVQQGLIRITAGGRVLSKRGERRLRRASGAESSSPSFQIKESTAQSKSDLERMPPSKGMAAWDCGGAICEAKGAAGSHPGPTEPGP